MNVKTMKKQHFINKLFALVVLAGVVTSCGSSENSKGALGSDVACQAGSVDKYLFTACLRAVCSG